MIRRPPRSTLLSLHDALPIFTAPMEEHDEHHASLVPDPAVPLPPRHRRHVREVLRRRRSEEHTSELQSLAYLVCRLLLEKKKSSHRSLRTAQTTSEILTKPSC